MGITKISLKKQFKFLSKVYKNQDPQESNIVRHKLDKNL